MTKVISISIDEDTEKILKMIVSENNCSVSEAVCVAISVLGKNPKFKYSSNTFELVNEKLKQIGSNPEEFCIKLGVTVRMLRHVCKGIDENREINGFGNYKNKWRDKSDGRVFKTHTSVIAYHLFKELGIGFENNKAAE